MAASPERPRIELEQRLAPLRNARGTYLEPSRAELSAHAHWLELVLSELGQRGYSHAPPPRGFRLESLGGELWLVAEDPEARRGAGALVLRTGPNVRNLLVEAPHTFFEAGTLPLALSVFENLRARALLINTVHRSAGTEPPPEDEHERRTLARSRLGTADLAHTEHSFYLTAHAQLVRLFDRAATVQLHGFRDETLPGVGCVVSPAGSLADARRVVEALRPVLGDKPPALYPSDVKRLGGTLNAQARNSVGQRAAFLHLELSRSLRDDLLRDAVRRTEFARAIRAGLLSGSG
jgi:hypothetical protein